MTNVLHLRQKGNAQVISHITWEQYEKIDQAFDSVPGIRRMNHLRQQNYEIVSQRELLPSLPIRPISPLHY